MDVAIKIYIADSEKDPGTKLAGFVVHCGSETYSTSLTARPVSAEDYNGIINLLTNAARENAETLIDYLID